MNRRRLFSHYFENQKGLSPILIVLLLAILGIGGYLFYTNYSNNRRGLFSDENRTKSAPVYQQTT